MFGWLRPKPPSDIAQAVIALMDDPAQWRGEHVFSLRHTSDLVIWNTGFFIRAELGGAGYRFDQRDQRAVNKAWIKLKKAMAQHRQSEAAARLRDALALPPPPPARPQAALEPAESLEAVEARVRKLREAFLHAAT